MSIFIAYRKILVIHIRVLYIKNDLIGDTIHVIENYEKRCTFLFAFPGN